MITIKLEEIEQNPNEEVNKLLENDFEQYTYIRSKEVYDSDGWRTEYTMYYDEVNDKYVFVFGDDDYYNPNDGYEEFDWECDTENEANEWFDNYTGFEDDLDESCIKETSDIWDINTAAKQSADAALKNIKQGIEDFEIEINTKVDRPNFWKQFRKEMTENGLDFEIKGKDTEWDDHYYYMYLYDMNIDESCNIKESSTKSYWKYNQFEDTLPGGDYYDKYTIKRFRLIPCETPEDCYEGDVRRFSAWAVCESEYPYKEVYCTKDEAYEYLIDFLNDGRYEKIHNI